jgi:SpoIID/LytB domain protein
VALAYGPTYVGTAADTFSFRYSGGRVVVSRTTAGVTAELGSATSVRVTWAGTRFARDLGRRPTLVNLVGPDDSFADRQHRYRFGLIDVRPIAASSSGPAGLMVLNAVRLHDEYLYGIAEVNASWPLEALRAQILASRSYAAAQMAAGIRKGCLCHSDDGGGPYYDQTFLGWVKVDEGSYSAAWRRAVDSTAVAPPLGVATNGLAIAYRGTVIAAYYTDSTGGRTRNVEDVWGGYAEPWARSVDDHWSLDARNSPSFAQWKPRLRDQAAMASMFGLPDVLSVEVTERAASGTAEKVTARSSTGATATVSGRTFCRTLNLPSRWVWGITPTA